MKNIFITITAVVMLSSCASLDNGKTNAHKRLDTSYVNHVKENSAVLAFDGIHYKLESYVKLFQQPYYVTVTRIDGKPITKSTAISVAQDYIKPRGCTQKIQLAPKLDKNTSDNTQWMIGILC